MSHDLTRAQREDLSQLLHQREQALRQQLQTHLRGRSTAEQALDDREQDGDDALQLASGREVGAALTQLEQRELAALTGALERLAEGRYGLCTDCGRHIPFARLRIEPQALRCVACASRHEQRPGG